jgi:hypothetical protein
VGVVYNAVDDHLSGPDQLHQRWALEDLRLLLPLLREAREARRVVVITADHGHLLEDGTTQLPGGESDRWRPGKMPRRPTNWRSAAGGWSPPTDRTPWCACGARARGMRVARTGITVGCRPRRSRCP